MAHARFTHARRGFLHAWTTVSHKSVSLSLCVHRFSEQDPVKNLPPRTSSVSTVSCCKEELSREGATRWNAHTNDSYLTVMTLNRREPICIDLNEAFFTNAGKKAEEGSKARCAGHQKMGKNG